MKKRVISGIMSVIMILLCTIGASASDINMEAQEQVLYTREESAIFEKIYDLEAAKAAVHQYKTMHSLVDDNNDPVYLSLVAEANTIREELIAMGAKPSKEELAALTFEPIEVNGVLIDDFADFEETYEAVYDLWGVERTVNSDSGTYYTYDILIQDVTGGSILATHITQSGRDGFDLHATSSPVSSLIVNELSTVGFDHLVSASVAGLAYSNWITGAFTALMSIISIASEIDPQAPVTATGHTKSHVIFCDSSPTVHFVFVRDSLTGTWYHTLTTNRTTILERHDIYYVISQNGTPITIDDESYSRERIVTPDDYGLRLTHAIRAYQYNRALYIDKLTGYTVVVKEDETDTVGVDVFTLSITCPEDQFDLFRYGLQ